MARCVADIETADLVALDFEFSGLFLDMERHHEILSMDAYYAKCVASIPHFLPLQLGICCVHHREADGVWELRPHELNLRPRSRRFFTSDLQSLRFLRSHGFDFNAFLDEGCAYERLPSLTGERKVMLRHQLPPAGKVVHTLRESRVPLVFHNGFLDALHLYHGFLGELPSTHQEFGKAWLLHFPLTFDTRYIAQDGRYKAMKHLSGLSLEHLHGHLVGCADVPLQFDRCQSGFADERRAHGSAGYDAMLTAEVFVAEADCWIRDAAAQSALKRLRKARQAELVAELGPLDWQEVHKHAVRAGVSIHHAGTGQRRRVADIKADIVAVECKRIALPEEAAGKSSRKRPRTEDISTGLSSPSLLESHKVCRQFHNVFAIVGAASSHLQLGSSGTETGAGLDSARSFQ